MNISSTPTSDKPCPTPEQDIFLRDLEGEMADEGDQQEIAQFRLAGGPGTGKSYTIGCAARKAAEDGWTVFLVGPTHQATGVLASAVPQAFPFEPDPKNLLRAGEVMYCTAHRLGAWVQKSRARGAAQGEEDPVPKDSWLGRAFRADWEDPPKGVLVIADETSMYPEQMVAALQSTLNTLQRECKRVIFLAVGDPNQLTPVRGPSYIYRIGEGPESPSSYVTRTDFRHHRLTQNVRAKDPLLRNVVETYLTHKTVPLPPQDKGAAYGWTEADDAFFETWSELVDHAGEASCIILGYRRAAVAFANDKLCMMRHGVPAHTLEPGRTMRIQETYSPRGSTLAASSDLVKVLEMSMIDDSGQIIDMILPPKAGHAPAHDDRVIQILHQIVEQDIAQNGALPTVSIEVMGDRAGMLRNVPAVVASEHDQMTSTWVRWAALEGKLTQAAFRTPHEDMTVRRGLAAIYYFVADSAKVKLEAPYAMTSHRSQGSTYRHVAVLADGCRGGRIVDHRIASARDASAYVMLSRASESLTIAWAKRQAPFVSSAPFDF